MVGDGYSNCYALPAEWMETIDNSYCANSVVNVTKDHFFMKKPDKKKGMFPSLIPNNKKKLVL